MTSHPCDACGGTGDQKWNPGYWAPKLCQVCLGVGWLSDSMPVSDALADAETLRRVKGRTGAFDPLREAAEWGEGVLSSTDPGGCAVYAASAAFRAVPGLRGE